jgi:hypothetical protein
VPPGDGGFVIHATGNSRGEQDKSSADECIPDGGVVVAPRRSEAAASCGVVGGAVLGSPAQSAEQ